MTQQLAVKNITPLTLETRFGPMPLDEDRILHFESGIMGFPGLERYLLMPLPEQDRFLLLQSCDETWLSFIVMPVDRPWIDHSDHYIKAEHILKSIAHLSISPEHAMIALIISVDEQGGVSANVKAPIVIDSQSNKAWQVILDDPSYALCLPLAQSNA